MKKNAHTQRYMAKAFVLYRQVTAIFLKHNEHLSINIYLQYLFTKFNQNHLIKNVHLMRLRLFYSCHTKAHILVHHLEGKLKKNHLSLRQQKLNE